jgi:hypothetical protein
MKTGYSFWIKFQKTVLTLNLVQLRNACNGLAWLESLEQSIQSLRDFRVIKKTGLPVVLSLIRTHGCAGWPGSMPGTKANRMRFQQFMGF